MKWLIFLCDFVLISAIILTTVDCSKIGCFKSLDLDADYFWNLTWQDDFTDEQPSSDNWEIPHESEYKCGDWENSISCEIRENSVEQNGFLILRAGIQKYGDRNYTAARVKSRKFFTHGRWEIRAKQPIGEGLKTYIFTVNDLESYWHENGYITISDSSFDYAVHRIHFSNSKDYNDRKSISYVKLRKNVNGFHLYGIEWSDKEIKFFIDEKYSETIQLTALKDLKPWHQIQMQIAVRNQNLDISSSTCPALIVDYVRIYDKVSMLKLTSQLHKCASDSQVRDEAMIEDELCQIARKTPTTFIPKTTSKVTTEMTTKTTHKMTTEMTTKKSAPIDTYSTGTKESNNLVIIIIAVSVIVIFIIATMVLAVWYLSTVIAKQPVQQTTNPVPKEEFELHEYAYIE